MATFPNQPPIQLGPSQHEIELTNLKDTPTRVGGGAMNSNGGDISTTLLPPLGVRLAADVATTPKCKCNLYWFFKINFSRKNLSIHSTSCIDLNLQPFSI